MIKTRHLLHFVILSFLPANAVCYGRDNSFQFWPSAGVAWEANKDWTLTYREQLRFNDGGGNLYQGQSDVGAIYKPFADWFDISIN